MGGGLALLATLQPITSSRASYMVQDVTMKENQATQGGGIYVDQLLSAPLTLGPNLLIEANEASEIGGGLAFGRYHDGALDVGTHRREYRWRRGMTQPNVEFFYARWHVL